MIIATCFITFMFIRSINWLYQHWQCELPVGSIWEEPWGGEGWPDYGWPYVGPHGSWLIITSAFFLYLIPMQVRGLFSPLQFAYAQFPCTDLSGEQMYDPFWEAVGRLEMCGFRVMALVSDGLSANRRLFRLHGTSDSTLCTKFLTPTVKTETCTLCQIPPTSSRLYGMPGLTRKDTYG